MYKRLLFVFFYLIYAQAALALNQNDAIWAGLTHQNDLSKDKAWKYSIHSQFRRFDPKVKSVNLHFPLKTVLVDGAIGYAITPKHIVWGGYYWADHFAYRHEIQEHRLWQQFQWKITDDDISKIHLRTRLEEIQFSHVSHNLVILRQALVDQFQQYSFGGLIPVAYEEVFFRLNHPPYAALSFCTRNRVFLGFKYYFSKKDSVEIGYLNEYDTPHRAFGAIMSHILMINYKFESPSDVLFNIAD
jgi:hypothetical protein